MIWIFAALMALFVGAAGSLAAPRRLREGLPIGLTAAAVAGVCCIVAGALVLRGDQLGAILIAWPLPLGSARWSLDGLSAWFLIIIGTVAIPAAIYSWGYFGAAHDHGSVRAFAPLLCVMVAAMIVLVTAGDMVLFLLGWEMMSLSAFFLVGFHDQDREARRGAWMYLVATHLGTALGTLPMFAAFVARSGSTAFADFGRAFHAGDSVWCVGLFVLGLIGFGTKAGFMPFHVWLPAAHPVAPSPVSALMSGVVIKTGIYGLLRMLSWLPALPAGCGIALVAVGMITGVMGILYALSQDQIKRMLAYSSIENIGIIGMAIGLGMLGRSLGHPLLEALGFGGALLHVLNHSLFKGLLFLSAGTVLHSTGTGRIESLGGLARRNPVNALAFLIGAVAICALPPLNGFLSEFLIYSGLLNGLIILPNAYAGVAIAATAALALIGGLALLAFSKVFAVVFLGETRDSAVQIHATPRTMSAAMMILAASCVVVGLSVRGIAPVLARVIHALDPVELGSPAAMNGSFATLSRVALPLGVFVVIVLVLGVMRLRLRPGAMAGGSGGTWGCGYAAPAARMQYTGASYAETLIFSFRHLLRPAHRGEPPSGYFPSGANIATESTDIVLKRGYEPLFARVARICERMWPLQHGRIQLYLVYIVVTVVVVFLVEAGWGSAGKTRGVAPNATKIAAVQTMPSPTPGLGEAHP